MSTKNEFTYRDFDLLIEGSERTYLARVLRSPAGEASVRFDLPFSALELENFLLKIGRPRKGKRRLTSPKMEAAKNFGKSLFEAVFGHEVLACFRSSLDQVGASESGLRLRLHLNASELNDLPWEYLYYPALNRFLALTVETPLVRYIELPERIRPLAVKPPLKILVMISSPHDYDYLDVEQEWQKLCNALTNIEHRRLVELERLEEATLSALQRRLRQGCYHILHFIGHGGFDEQAQDGILLFEDELNRGRRVSGQYLGALLHNHRSLRLAVLNACEGARSSRTDPFTGTAQSLVQQGMPAVIAMQFEISDAAAITFAQEFYAAIADSYPVDAALVEARMAIFANENDVEWGTPVLYMRSSDGRIFDIDLLKDEKSLEDRSADNETRKPHSTKSMADNKHQNSKANALLENSLKLSTFRLRARQILISSILVSAIIAIALILFQRLNSHREFKTIPPEEMAYIPSGTFWMGNRANNKDPILEHEIMETFYYVDAFYMDKYEVTVEKFEKFIEATGYKTDAENDGWSYIWTGEKWEKRRGINWHYNAKGESLGIEQKRHPVIHITWNDAKAYAKWMKKRLPTEVEWEYAARCGSMGYKYSWGNGNPIAEKGGNIADESAKRAFKKLVIWRGYDDKHVYTASVGSFAPNEFELYDMTGNVWEWCANWYDDDNDEANPNRNFPELGNRAYRILHGGAWGSDPLRVRCTVRFRINPNFRSNVVGFRCVQVVR